MGGEILAAIDLLGMLIFAPRTGLLIVLLGFAAWFDWRTHRIPNVLSFGGILLGVLLNSLLPGTAALPWVSLLAGLVTGFVLFLPLYLLRALGAADVKLMAMVGVFLGFPATLHAVLATLLAGGVMALFHAASRGQLGRLIERFGQLLRHAGLNFQTPAQSLGELPYGLAIAGGTATYLIVQQLGVL